MTIVEILLDTTGKTYNKHHNTLKSAVEQKTNMCYKVRIEVIVGFIPSMLFFVGKFTLFMIISTSLPPFACLIHGWSDDYSEIQTCIVNPLIWTALVVRRGGAIGRTLANLWTSETVASVYGNFDLRSSVTKSSLCSFKTYLKKNSSTQIIISYFL